MRNCCCCWINAIIKSDWIDWIEWERQNAIIISFNVLHTHKFIYTLVCAPLSLLNLFAWEIIIKSLTIWLIYEDLLPYQRNQISFSLLYYSELTFLSQQREMKYVQRKNSQKATLTNVSNNSCHMLEEKMLYDIKRAQHKNTSWLRAIGPYWVCDKRWLYLLRSNYLVLFTILTQLSYLYCHWWCC